jgi:hypothetical protein
LSSHDNFRYYFIHFVANHIRHVTHRSPSTIELLIKKSRFIGCVQPVADRAAAQQVVAALRSAASTWAPEVDDVA